MPDANGAMSLLYGAGDGTFPTPQLIDATPMRWQALAGDVDGDGRLDLTSMSTTDPDIFALAFALAVRRGSGDRTAPFGESTTYATGEGLSTVLLADLDGDGRRDLVAAVRAGFELRRGQTGGPFAPVTMIASRDEVFSAFFGLPTTTAVAADWNGDHVLDLVYNAGPPLSGTSLHFQLGRGDGTFDPEVACALSMGTVGDVDGDGRPDLLSGANLLLGLDTCSPRKVVPLSDWPEGGVGVFADLDGDGNPDLVVDGKSTVRLGDGKGGFTKTVSLPGVGSGTPSRGTFLVADLNRDTKMDVVYARPNGWAVFLNTCP